MILNQTLPQIVKKAAKRVQKEVPLLIQKAAVLALIRVQEMPPRVKIMHIQKRNWIILILARLVLIQNLMNLKCWMSRHHLRSLDMDLQYQFNRRRLRE